MYKYPEHKTMTEQLSDHGPIVPVFPHEEETYSSDSYYHSTPMGAGKDDEYVLPSEEPHIHHEHKRADMTWYETKPKPKPKFMFKGYSSKYVRQPPKTK